MIHPSIDELRSWYDARKETILSDYFTFLKFPSISTDPAHKQDIRNAAHWVEEHLKEIGFSVELWETSGNPVVFAEHQAGKDRPTVLIYHHYDVQPIDPINQWKSPPFEPELRDGFVYARGASDNKGQCFNTLTTLKAVFDLCQNVNLNIKLFVEGEEECGSAGALQVLKEKKERLKADYVLVIDMGIPAENQPSITIGLRGIVTMEVKCTNSKIDLHSGVMGGIVLNPNRALVQLLAKMWDESGKITIPGFYDDVKVPAQDELKEITQDYDEAFLRKQFGIKSFQGEGSYSIWESNTIRPTLEINGISGGYTGPGFKTVIPSHANAKISCRLVPGQDPKKIVHCITQFLEKIAPKGLEIEVTPVHGGRAVRTSPHTKLAQVCSEAYSEVFGKPCQKVFCGASVPLVADLTDAIGGEVAMIGVDLATDDIHAPNEHFGLNQLQKGYLTLGRILGRLMSC